MGMDWNITVLIGLPFNKFDENQRNEIDKLREKHYGDLPDGLVYVIEEGVRDEIYVGYPLMKRYMRGDDTQKLDIDDFTKNVTHYRGKFYARFGLEPAAYLTGEYW